MRDIEKIDHTDAFENNFKTIFRPTEGSTCEEALESLQSRSAGQLVTIGLITDKNQEVTDRERIRQKRSQTSFT